MKRTGPNREWERTRMVRFYFHGWESSPREIQLFVSAFGMLFLTIFSILTVIIAMRIPDHIQDPEWLVLFTFAITGFVFIAAYLDMRRRRGVVWSMSSKEWEEPKTGAVDTIGDILKGEGISYSRTGPITIKDWIYYSIEEVFEMDGLRLMVHDDKITKAWVGPMPLFGSKRANEVMRLVNRALE